MESNGNTTWFGIVITVLSFAFIQLLNPFGVAESSQALSERFIQRIGAYCYNDTYRDRIVVLLIRGKELATIGSGWPMSLNLYVEYLDWLAEQEPAAVFLDIGLIQGGSIAGLSHEPCALANGSVASESLPVWAATFKMVFPSLKDSYSPVIDWKTGAPNWKQTQDHIPLVLGSANPLLASWLVDLNRSRAQDNTTPEHAPSPSAQLLPPCFNDFSSASPIRWTDSGGYPLAIQTDASGTLEPSPAYLLLGAYCQRATPQSRPPLCAGLGVEGSPVKLTTPEGKPLPPLEVQWGHRRRYAEGFDDYWVGCEREPSAREFWYALVRDMTRGIQTNENHLTRCPVHPTLPFIIGNEWPSGAAENPKDVLKGSIVIVGAYIDGYLDQIDSPVHGAYPGPLYHAMALDNLFHFGLNYPRPPSSSPWGKHLPTFVELLAIVLSTLVGREFRRRYLIAGDYGALDFKLRPILAHLVNLRAPASRQIRTNTPHEMTEAADRHDLIVIHNLEVQATALKLAAITMAGVYAVYAAALPEYASSVLNIFLAVALGLAGMSAALFPSLLMALIGLVVSLPRGCRIFRALILRPDVRAHDRVSLIRFVLASAATIVAAATFLSEGCAPAPPAELTFSVSLVSFLVAFWLGGTVKAFSSNTTSIAHQHHVLTRHVDTEPGVR